MDCVTVLLELTELLLELTELLSVDVANTSYSEECVLVIYMTSKYHRC